MSPSFRLALARKQRVQPLTLIFLTGDGWLKNVILDNLDKLTDDKYHFSIDTRTIGLIWDQTPRKCNLRRWLVNALAENTAPKTIDAWGDDLPHDLLRAMFKAKCFVPTGFEVEDRCTYHDHGEGIQSCERDKIGQSRG